MWNRVFATVMWNYQKALQNIGCLLDPFPHPQFRWCTPPTAAPSSRLPTAWSTAVVAGSQPCPAPNELATLVHPHRGNGKNGSQLSNIHILTLLEWLSYVGFITTIQVRRSFLPFLLIILMTYPWNCRYAGDFSWCFHVFRRKFIQPSQAHQ